jgi:hypothetical protein
LANHDVSGSRLKVAEEPGGICTPYANPTNPSQVQQTPFAVCIANVFTFLGFITLCGPHGVRMQLRGAAHLFDFLLARQLRAAWWP